MANNSFDFNSVFNTVKDALSNNRRGSAIYSEKLKLKSGGTYRFRILPYVKEGSEGQHKTVRHVTKFYWTDEVGQPKSVVSLLNSGSDTMCPVASYYSRVNKTGTAMEVEFLKKTLRPSDNWLYNVYVIEDSLNKENVGKVKILAAGRRINEIITSAFAGKYDKKFASFGRKDYNVGPHIFDLSENGADLVIEVKTRNGFNNYDETMFLPADSAVPEEALEQCFDLWQLDPVLPVEEIQKIFNDSYLSAVMSAKNVNSDVVSKASSDDTTASVMSAIRASEVSNRTTPTQQPTAQPGGTTEEAINDFLDEF